jgi:glycosidase
MTNGAFDSLDEIMDIESHNVDKMAKGLGIINPFRWKLIKTTSRDNARTPMQWNGKKNAGFTSGTPWLKLHTNYTDVNVQNDLKNKDGVIAFFKSINSYKKSSEVMKEGSFKALHIGKSVYAFEREYEGKKLTVLCNFSTKTKEYPIAVDGKKALSNYSKEDVKLRPYEFVLIENK